MLCQRLRGLAPVSASPKADEVVFLIKQLHLMEGGQIDDQPPRIGRLPAKPVSTAAHRQWQTLLTRKTQSLHNILMGLSLYNACRAPRLIEDVAQFLIGIASRHNHFSRDVLVEFSKAISRHRYNVLSQVVFVLPWLYCRPVFFSSE